MASQSEATFSFKVASVIPILQRFVSKRSFALLRFKDRDKDSIKILWAFD